MEAGGGPFYWPCRDPSRHWRHFECLKVFLLDQEGRCLGEIIRLMMAVETERLGSLIARVQPGVQIPAGAEGLTMRGSRLRSGWLVPSEVPAKHLLTEITG
jgi:hypothetical protein